MRTLIDSLPRQLWENDHMEEAMQAAIREPVIAAPRDHRIVFLALALFTGYVLLDGLTYHFPGRFGITPFNPEAALALALLMICGLKYLPVVFVATAVGEIVFQAVSRPLLGSLLCSVILTAGYACAAMLLVGRLRIGMALGTRGDVLRLVAVALPCMLICGLAYVAILTHFQVGLGGRYFYGVRRFFIGYSVSILVVAPLIFMMFDAERRRQLAAIFRSREAWLQFATVAVCHVWVFQQYEPQHAQNFYVLFIPLIWMATRFGIAGAALALALVQIGLFLLFFLSGYKPLSVFELQFLMIALAITGLLLGVAIDEQRRLSLEYRESLKLAAAGEMAATIAHEINQPLTALSGYATAAQLMAVSNPQDHVQLRNTMEKMLTETRRAAAVVKRLRDFFRTGATRLEPVALEELAARVAAYLRSRADLAHVALVCRAAGPVPPVYADPLQIEVVVRNLIQNAMESAAGDEAKPGRVDVITELNAAGEVVVSVQDSGAGILDSDTERLFESFVTSKSTGMGMGLAISRAIVDAHGGRIWAVPGKSGLVCFALPPAALPGHKT